MAPRSKAKYHGIPGELPRQCEATRRDGSRCRQSAIRGGNTCRTHGSGTILAKEAARRRLAAMVDPALKVLNAALTAKKSDPVSKRLKMTAARDVLDRNGLKAKEELVLHAAFDATRFADWSTEDLELFVSLARRASTHPVAEKSSEALPEP